MKIYLLITLLSLADGLLTIYGLENQLVLEANPLMAEFLSSSHASFLMNKMTLTCLGLYVLYKNRYSKLARFSTRLLLILYILLIIYHLIGLGFFS